MKLNSSRDLFFNRVGEAMEREDIYIVSADLAGRPFDEIRAKHPNRYVSVGIAEQNMISVASGIALSGKKTIAYTSNPFIAFRAFDQIRNAVALMDIPLAIAGVGVGFGISEYGTTHFITEDFAMMSLCPNMRIITVSDETIAEEAYKAFLAARGPMYLRFDKQCSGKLLTDEDGGKVFERGFRWLRRCKSQRLIVATGYMAQLALESENAAVIDLFSLPFEIPAFLEILKEFEGVWILEEQQRRGGLGSYLLEILNGYPLPAKIELRGIDYGRSFPSTYGSRDYWLKEYGLK